MSDYTDAPKFLKQFLTYMDTVKGKSQKTTDAYYSDLRTFFRYLKVIKGLTPMPTDFKSQDPDKSIASLKNITIRDVRLGLISSVSLAELYEYMAYLNRTRQNQARARARKSSSIKALYNYLTNKTNQISNNPAKELESPKIGKALPRHLDLTDSKMLLKAVGDGPNHDRDYLILTLFLNCGLRLSELVGININDIRSNTLTVIGKGNKERTIYLNNACKNALLSYMRARPTGTTHDKNALFLNKNHTRLGARSVQNIVRKYLALAGLDTTKYSPHKLRHTAATLMYQHGGVDIRVLQEILGHQSLSTTQIYTHIDDERLRSAVDRNPLADIE